MHYYHRVNSDLLWQEVDSQGVFGSVRPQLDLSQHLQEKKSNDLHTNTIQIQTQKKKVIMQICQACKLKSLKARIQKYNVALN